MSTKGGSLYGEVLRASEQATGKFYCFNCRIAKPVAQKTRAGNRIMCYSCVAKKTAPRKMQAAKTKSKPEVTSGD